MRKRCRCKTRNGYDNYGGRGITITPRWDRFENFLVDMGEKPDGMSLDRIDNNGNYSPENCRWATPLQQSNNRRNGVRVEMDGKSMTLKEISEKYSIPLVTVRSRYKGGRRIVP